MFIYDESVKYSMKKWLAISLLSLVAACSSPKKTALSEYEKDRAFLFESAVLVKYAGDVDDKKYCPHVHNVLFENGMLSRFCVDKPYSGEKWIQEEYFIDWNANCLHSNISVMKGDTMTGHGGGVWYSSKKDLKNLEAKLSDAVWDYFTGKVDKEKGVIEGGVLAKLHESANILLILSDSAKRHFEEFENNKTVENRLRWSELYEIHKTQSEKLNGYLDSVSLYQKKAKSILLPISAKKLENSLELVKNKLCLAKKTYDGVLGFSSQK